MPTQRPPPPPQEKNQYMEEICAKFMEQTLTSFKAIEVYNQNMKASIRNLEVQMDASCEE